jgi:ficolin
MSSSAGFVAPVRSLNGWIIIQEAYNLIFNWSRPWADYRAGFGQLGLDYWFGLEKIHQMTAASSYQIRFEVRVAPPSTQTMLWLQMASFSVGSEMTYYKLAWSGMTGSTEMTSVLPAPPSTFHNGMVFSTYDNNYNTMTIHDCPNVQEGAWWFNDCYSICPTCLANNNNCGSRIGFNVAGGAVCANFTRVMIQAI